MKILVSIFGICSACITAIILASLELYTGMAFYSFTFLFIIPVGAIGAGICASSGYYLGAKVFNEKPAGGIAINMIAASVGTYLMVNYISYYFMEYDGERIKDFITFWKYLDTIIKETSLSFYIKGRSIGSIGKVGPTYGYIYAILQVVGFALGGLALYLSLVESPYCKNCSKYMKKADTQERFTSDSDKLATDINAFLQMIKNGLFDDSKKFHADSMGVIYGGEQKHGTRITSYKCNTCGMNAMDFAIFNKKGDNEKEIKSYRFFTT